MKQYTFKNAANDTVYYLKWETTSPQAVVVISHGMIEHPERYDELALYLNQYDISVYAIYHIGHGEVAEVLNHMGEGDFDKCISNLRELVTLVKEENENNPVILLAHSMGSMMAQHYITRYQDIDGLILSGSTKSTFLFKAGAVISTLVTAFTKDKTKPCKLLYKIAFGMYNNYFKNPRTEFDWLNRKEDEIDKYLADPYCGGVCSASFYKNVMVGMATMGDRKMLQNIDLSLPVYIHGGACDPVSDMGKGLRHLEEQYKRLGMKNVKLDVYPEDRHEIYHEWNKQEVYENTLEFVRKVEKDWIKKEVKEE